MTSTERFDHQRREQAHATAAQLVLPERWAYMRSFDQSKMPGGEIPVPKLPAPSGSMTAKQTPAGGCVRQGFVRMDGLRLGGYGGSRCHAKDPRGYQSARLGSGKLK
jgi:hypothetical protein